MAGQDSGWRYLLFELNGDGTESFIKGGVPLSGVSATRNLSGPHQITGQLNVPERDLVGPDGSPLLRRWKTTLYVEDPNQAIWCGGVLVDYTIDGPVLKVDVSGFSTQIKGQPFDGELRAVQTDPLVVVRAFWDHSQGKPGGDLGLVVDDVATPVKLGEEPEDVTVTPTEISQAANELVDRLARLQPVGEDMLFDGASDNLKKYAPTFLSTWSGARNPIDRGAFFWHLSQWTEPPQKLDAAQQVRKRFREDQSINADWTWPDMPQNVAWHHNWLLQQYGGQALNKGAAVAWLTGYINANIEKTASSQPNNVTVYNWWSTDDMGGVIDELAKSTPFDYLEEHEWDGDVIRHRLRIGYPRIGSQKPDARFVLGENVTVQPSEEFGGDDVVTEIWVLGSGEGRTKVRGVAAVNPSQSVRRVKIIDDPKIQNQAAADARARDELARYQPDMPGAGITTLVVSNHSNAEFGTFNVGDDVIFSGSYEWGDIAIWVRIVSMTISPDDSDNMTLAVVRTDTLKA